MDLFHVLKVVIAIGVLGFLYILFFELNYNNFSWDVNRSAYIGLLGFGCTTFAGGINYRKHKTDLSKNT